jgi:hypothetical protein
VRPVTPGELRCGWGTKVVATIGPSVSRQEDPCTPAGDWQPWQHLLLKQAFLDCAPGQQVCQLSHSCVLNALHSPLPSPATAVPGRAHAGEAAAGGPDLCTCGPQLGHNRQPRAQPAKPGRSHEANKTALQVRCRHSCEMVAAAACQPTNLLATAASSGSFPLILFPARCSAPLTTAASSALRTNRHNSCTATLI